MPEPTNLERRPGALGLAIAVLLGATFRAALVLPVGRFRGESDAVLTGLTAFQILRGDYPIFYSGVRLGALESYFHAAAFRLFGVSMESLLLTPFLAGVAFVFVFGLFARELLGDRCAIFAALLVAVPSPAVASITMAPQGYDSTMLLCAGALWFASRIVNGKTIVLSSWLLGLCAGLALWNNPLSVAVTLPALTWVAFRRVPDGRSRVGARVFGGFLAGASPFLGFNLRYRLRTFRTDAFPIRPAGSFQQTVENGVYFVRYDLKEILFSSRTRCPHLPAAANTVLGAALALEIAIAAILVAARVTRFRRPGSGLREDGVWADLLPLLIVAATAAANVFSWTGGVRGETSRYALPVALATPILLATLYGRVASRRPGKAGFLTAGMLAGVIAFHAGNSCLACLRPADRRSRAAENRLVAFLERERVAFVVGDYWDLYGINFLTQEKVLAVTDYGDIEHYGAALPVCPARFGLVSWQPGFVERWADVAHLSGRVVAFGENLEAFLPEPDPPGREIPRRIARRLNGICLKLRPPPD